MIPPLLVFVAVVMAVLFTGGGFFIGLLMLGELRKARQEQARQTGVLLASMNRALRVEPGTIERDIAELGAGGIAPLPMRRKSARDIEAERREEVEHALSHGLPVPVYPPAIVPGRRTGPLEERG